MPAHHYEVLRARRRDRGERVDERRPHRVPRGRARATSSRSRCGSRAIAWATSCPASTAERLAAQQSVVRAERRQRYEDVPYGAERFAIGARALSRGPPAAPPDDRPATTHIQAATVDDVLAFYRTWYVPANATLVIAGDVDRAEVDALRRSLLRQLPGVARARRAPMPRSRRRRPDPRSTRRRSSSRRSRAIHRAWLGPRRVRAPTSPSSTSLTAGVVRGRHRRAVAPARLRDPARAARVGVDDQRPARRRDPRRGRPAHRRRSGRRARDPRRGVRAAASTTARDRARGHAPRGRRDLGAVRAVAPRVADPALHALHRASPTASPPSSRATAP